MQHLSVGTKSQGSRNKNNSQKNLGLKRETEKGRLQNKTDLIDSRLGVCVHVEKRTSTTSLQKQKMEWASSSIKPTTCTAAMSSLVL